MVSGAIEFKRKLLVWRCPFLSAIYSDIDRDLFDCHLKTPLVRLLSFKIGAVDYPNARRINVMPSAGGYLL